MRIFDYDLGIIGGGAAGLTAAAGGAQFGAKTVIVEKSGRLGGDCLHFGCVPSKTLIRTAGVWNLARRSREFGLPALSLPPVDIGIVMDRVREVIATIQGHDSVDRFCSLGAEVLFGSPSFTDDHSVSIKGKTISAKSWIIATGSRPTTPPIEGLAQVPFLTNETVFSLKRLPTRLIVLGGGPLGLELAQAFARLGSKVIIVEFMDQVLGPEDADLADIIKESLESEGVEILTSHKALRAEMQNGVVNLTVASTKGEGRSLLIKGDAIITATGRVPNAEGLGLERAGVAFSPKGIPTDARMRTNIPHIYA
ncbi:MAG: FAD-dependent oxidoreductase, partial [Syntrophales bacterium]|nr:FAD-dependent oxidoreductase [Syntrophales bacterium]